MPPQDPHPELIDLAAAIADGTPVDWSAAETGASAEERHRLQALRLLERVADVHHRAEPGDLPHHDGAEPAPPPAFWGPLRIVDRLGRGAFSEVYRAWDERLDRHVALKLLTLRGALATAGETIPAGAVLDEGRLLARVRHPGVVVVHGADEIDGRVGIWMELVEGRTLAADVEARGPLPAAEVLQIGLHVAEALAAVHAAGLIHRDVKAQNVMREAGGRTVLMDFGTGVEFGDHAETAALAGTPLYLAPEVLAGGTATTRSDVYALGVLLFHLATGDFPVRGSTLREIRHAHARGERRAIGDLRSDLPRALTAIITRALNVDPAARFANAADLADSLRASAARSAWTRRAVSAGVAAIAVIAAATFIGLRLGKTAPARPAGKTWVQVPPEFVLAANLRGPTVDGQWAPCTSPRGTSNLALCNLITREVRVLRTPDPPIAYEFIGQRPGRALISPDGRRLVYRWEGVPDAGITVLHVINVDGTQQRYLFETSLGLALEEWTPDGRHVLIREASGTPQHRALLVPVDGNPPHQVLTLTPQDQRATLSPDGRTMVVERQVARGNADLLAFDVTTGAEQWRLQRPTNDMSPIWQPDGRAILFVGTPDGCRVIQRLPVVDGRPVAEQVAPLHDMGPLVVDLWGFGAHGALLVQGQDRIRTAFVAPINLARGEFGSPSPLPASCTDVTMGASWNRDGSQVAFVRGTTARDAQMSVVVSSAAGTGEIVYPIPGRWVEFSEVRWSPDDRFLAVTHLAPDGVGVASIVDLANRTVREVARPVTPTGAVRRPRWDPSGRGLLYKTNGIRRVDPDTLRYELVYSPPPEANGRFVGMLTDAAIDIADDGSIITALLGADGSLATCRVRIVRLDGSWVDRHTFTDSSCHGMAWSRDGTKILVATIRSAAPPSTTLWLLGRDAGEPVRLAGELRPFWDFALSPDESSLLLTLGSGPPTVGVLAGIPDLEAPPPPRMRMPAKWHAITPTPRPEVTLSGRVTDEHGRPVEGVYVYSHRRTLRNGRPVWTVIPIAEPTDRDGRYLLPKRPPGDYALVASANLNLPGDRSERRAPPPVVGPDGVRLAYVSTPYRMTGATSREPSVVAVTDGGRTGLDIQLERQPVFTIRGSVAGLPSNVAPPGVIDLTRVRADHELPGGGRRTPLNGGKFTFEDVPQGTYRIALTAGDRSGEVTVVIADRTPPPVTLTLKGR